MIEEAASILAHHQTEKQAEESGNFLFSSSLSSAGLRQRRPMNHLSTATAMEGSSVSAPGGGGTSRAKKPLPPPKASTLVGITNSAGNLTDSSNFSSAPNRAEDQKMKRNSLVILESTVEHQARVLSMQMQAIINDVGSLYMEYPLRSLLPFNIPSLNHSVKLNGISYPRPIGWQFNIPQNYKRKRHAAGMVPRSSLKMETYC